MKPLIGYIFLAIGISFGIGLSKSLSIPIYGVSSLQSIIFSHKTVSANNEHFLVAIKARGKDYFFQLFDEKSEPLVDAIKMTILAAKEEFAGYNLFFLGVGSGLKVFLMVLQKNLNWWELGTERIIKARN